MTSNAIAPATSVRRRRLRCGLRSGFRTGFTMVEMLTVIGIIVILMAVLLPTVGKVKQQAYVAHTKSTMSLISQAIEQYYLEYKAYPGPLSNTAITNKTTFPGVTGNVTSTENMVIALTGGLRISGGKITYVSNDVAISAGPLNLSPNPVMQTRHTAFIDATPGQNMPDQPWDKVGGNGNVGSGDSTIPEFSDKFPPRFTNTPRPILYVRAVKGNAALSSTGEVCGPNDDSQKSGQYNYSHLQVYGMANGYDFGGPNNSKWGTTPPFPANATPLYPVDSQKTQLSDSPYFASWSMYLGNPNALDKNGRPTAPRGKDAYILISAGLDGIFGTTDDIIYP